MNKEVIQEACGFDYPPNMNPRPHAPIYYGNQNVPRPTNSAAKEANEGAIIRAVNEGK